jgi:signal peptidase I
MEFDLSKLREPTASNQKAGLKPAARNGFLVVLLLVFLFLTFFFFNFQTIVVKGESMLPTFKPDQRILVCKAIWLVGPLRQGDIVVVRSQSPGEYLVKRVYAVAGSKVDYRYQPFNWDYTQGQFSVPEGHLYLLGDNLANSEDSREFGPIALGDVLGKVVER